MRDADYIIYEQPQPPILDLPTLENPMLDNPTQENPTLENPTQLNKECKVITDSKITDLSSIHPSIYPAERGQDAPPDGGIDRRTATKIYRDIVKENIEYDKLW